jgi:glycosyltransferase involved in cell wall biosynthesis
VISSKRNQFVERASLSSLGGKVQFLLGFIPSLLFCAKIIRGYCPDVIHINAALLPIAAMAGRICDVPVVWHMRESFSEFGSLWSLYEKYIGRMATRVVAVSNAIADQFEGRTREKVVTIHNGVPRAEFNVVSATRIDAFKHAFNLSSHLLVGLVGRIKFERKGQEYLVRAAALLKGRFPDVRYLIIGSPFPGNEEHQDRLLAMIAELGLSDVFILTGDVEDIKAAYASLDISLMTSALPEPFGGVVIESMAMGLPVIGADLGGTPEQVVDGETGFLVPPKDPVKLADALIKLLDDEALRARLGAAGRKRFEQYFEFENFYFKMMTVYREVGK